MDRITPRTQLRILAHKLQAVHRARRMLRRAYDLWANIEAVEKSLGEGRTNERYDANVWVNSVT